MSKIKSAPLEKIDQPSWRADYNLNAVFQCAELILVADTTVNSDRSGAPVSRCSAKIGTDLTGKLSGGRHHEPLRSARLRELGIVTLARHYDPLQQGNAEGQGLAGTGTSLTDHVGTSQGNGNRQRLDSKWCCDATFIEGLHDWIEYAKLGESSLLAFGLNARLYLVFRYGFGIQGSASVEGQCVATGAYPL